MFKRLSFFYFIVLSFSLRGQDQGIQTINDLGVESLVKDVFIKGNCRNVSNITAIGNDTLSIGQFGNGANIINIEDGIILSTGAIALAQGPNINNESSFPFNIESDDADLTQVATANLFDATGIEFDFVPMDDKVTFRYVFASEEYCEFVGTTFNDVFGFFVSGPGINGPFDNNAINVATITTLNATTETVSINNINHLSNETFYISNITTTDAQNCEINYVATFQDLIDYDGFTIALTASFPVIPCETYHIRLVLGDVGDANLDSAVFLASKSFDLGEPSNIRAEVPGSSEPIAYEGCVDGQFVFSRSASSNINEALTIDYNISTESEAINGVDFLEIPLSITIPAGDTSTILPITIIDDNLAEGPENLQLELSYDCDCIDPVLSELIINETSELSVSFDGILVCEDQAFSLTPVITGGVPPFDFLWETGATTESLNTSVSELMPYTVMVTDFCGNMGLGIVNVAVQDIPTATLTGSYDLCETVEIGIPVLLQGNPPWGLSYSINGLEQTPIDNIQTNPFYLATPTAGTYILTAFNDEYCEGVVVGSALVESPFFVATEVTSPSCFNSLDGSIAITQLDGIAPFSITWNVDTEDDYLIDNLQEGTYSLKIVDANGCVYEELFELSAGSNDIRDCIQVYIPNSFSPNGDGINDVFSIFFDTSGEIDAIHTFQVYNRWGGLVFEQRNFNLTNGITSWNGEFKGRPLDAGLYVYKVVLMLKDGSTQLYSGDVSLFR